MKILNYSLLFSVTVAVGSMKLGATEMPIVSSPTLQLIDTIRKNSIIDELDYVFAIIAVESQYVTTAKSPKGALGLMQITPIAIADIKKFTANLESKRLMMVILKPEEEWILYSCGAAGVERLTDPATNVRLGTCFIAILKLQYRTWTEILAHYNGGGIQVNKLREGRPLHRETSNYINKVNYYRELLNNE